jgi:DNA polymerase-1
VNKLLVVDGNAVLHRAYYALPDWRNRSGEATAGVYGFLSMLIGTIDQLKPTHLAVVFDTPAPTFRHQMYVGYQTNREKERQVSEDIWGQVEKLKIVFDKLGTPVFSVPGFEADDVIGTLSFQSLNSKSEGPNKHQIKNLKKQTEVVIITGDRDLMQLVDDRTFLYMPQKGLSDGILIDKDKVMEKLGVHPEQVVDYKALVGDSSDNYPGVTGIGPKTAIHLLAEYGSFEEIYKQILNSKFEDPNKSQMPKSQIQKLIDGYEGGKLSKELATIRRDVPVTLELEKCRVPEKGKFVEVFRELNYKSLAGRLTGQKEEKDENQIGLFD